MKKIWIVSLKTSLPDVAESFEDLKTEMKAYLTFEGARTAARKILRDLAFRNNAMFDGNGKLRHFEEYVKGREDDASRESDVDWEEGECNPKDLRAAAKMLSEIFSGNESLLSDYFGERKDAYYCDWMIEVEFWKNGLKIRGEDDGPCNGYNPVIDTDMLSMTEEKDYHLYIDDLFGQDVSSELYLDIRQTELEEA